MINQQYLLDVYVQHALTLKGSSATTVKSEKSIVSRFFRFLHPTTITDVDLQTVQRFLYDSKANRNLKAKTIRNYIQSLVNFFDFCVAERIISDNPAREIKRPPTPKSLPRFLSKEQIRVILDAIEVYPYHFSAERLRAKAVFHLFLYSGLRRRELLNLRADHVRIEDRQIHVIQGKGSKDRTIPLHPFLIHILKEYQAEQGKQGIISPWFFTALHSGKPFKDFALVRLVSKIRKYCGIHFVVHQFRHSFGTWAYQSGVDLLALSKMMGHSDIKTTMIYAHASTGHLVKEMQKVRIGEFDRFAA